MNKEKINTATFGNLIKSVFVSYVYVYSVLPTLQRTDHKCSHVPRTSLYNDTQATGFRYVTRTFFTVIYRQTYFPVVTYRQAG